MGHLKMMGAVQPFISGAISKTVNLPSEVTVEEIEKAYIEGWRLGLKAVAVYRDGSKRTQPMSTSARTRSPARARLAKAVRCDGIFRSSVIPSRTSLESPAMRGI